MCQTLAELSRARPQRGAAADEWKRAGQESSEYTQQYLKRLVHGAGQWHLVPPLSRPPAVDPTGTYHHVATIISFKPVFRQLDGNSHPRLLVIHLSDGGTHQELLKGSEDLRQDAVVQQVFTFINQRLQQRATLPRMRTYGVVPLAHDSGTASAGVVVSSARLAARAWVDGEQADAQAASDAAVSLGIIEFVSNTEPLYNIIDTGTRVSASLDRPCEGGGGARDASRQNGGLRQFCQTRAASRMARPCSRHSSQAVHAAG